jgi:EmrB/QacA subfamily drug resistance transporter
MSAWISEVECAPESLSRTQPWSVLAAIGLATFLLSLHVTGVLTVLPVLSNSLGSNLAMSEWVITAYLLALGSTLLIFGSMGDAFGKRRIYRLGLVAFIVTSAVCGFASNIFLLIAFRALQGLGAAMLSANSPAILTGSFPSTKLGRALGWHASMTYLGLIVGPVLSAWLTDHLSWGAVFLANLPIGLAALFLAYRFLPSQDEARPGNWRIPWWEATTWLGVIAPLSLAINRGATWGWLSPRMLLLLAFTAMFCWLFLRIRPRTMLDLALFRICAIRIATLNEGLYYSCLYSVGLLIPLFLIRVRGFDPVVAGSLLSVQSLSRTVAAPFSGIVCDKLGARTLVLSGTALLFGCVLWLSRVGPETTPGYLAVVLFFLGVATGIFVPANSSALMAAAPLRQKAIAAATLATARNLGMLLGVAFAGAIYRASQSSNGERSLSGIRNAFLATTGIAAVGFFISARSERSSNSSR